jgi:hypothetical protein
MYAVGSSNQTENHFDDVCSNLHPFMPMQLRTKHTHDCTAQTSKASPQAVSRERGLMAGQSICSVMSESLAAVAPGFRFGSILPWSNSAKNRGRSWSNKRFTCAGLGIWDQSDDSDSLPKTPSLVTQVASRIARTNLQVLEGFSVFPSVFPPLTSAFYP